MEYGPTTGFAAAAAFTLKIVKEYLERSKTEGASMEEGTFMARLMKIHQEKPETMSEIDALNVCLGNVTAGSDTTSITLTSVFWGLLRNSEAYAKVNYVLNTGKRERAG